MCFIKFIKSSRAEEIHIQQGIIEESAQLVPKLLIADIPLALMATSLDLQKKSDLEQFRHNIFS